MSKQLTAANQAETHSTSLSRELAGNGRHRRPTSIESFALLPEKCISDISAHRDNATDTIDAARHDSSSAPAMQSEIPSSSASGVTIGPDPEQQLKSPPVDSTIQPKSLIEWKEELHGAPIKSSEIHGSNTANAPLMAKPDDREVSYVAIAPAAKTGTKASTTAISHVAVAAQAVSAATRSTPTLLGIPTELRSRIFELAATLRGDVIEPTNIHFIVINWNELSQPGLALVNKQLRSEVLPMWRHITLNEVAEVEANVFDYEFSSLLNFLRALPERRLRLEITLSFPTNPLSTLRDRRERLKEWLDSMEDRSGKEDDDGYYKGLLNIRYLLSKADKGRSDCKWLFDEVEKVATEAGRHYVETYDFMAALTPDDMF